MTGVGKLIGRSAAPSGSDLGGKVAHAVGLCQNAPSSGTRRANALADVPTSRISGHVACTNSASANPSIGPGMSLAQARRGACGVSRRRAAGIVDDDVEMTVLCDNAIDHGAHRVGVTHVALLEQERARLGVVRPQVTTVAPAAANRWPMRRPMPRVPPVTSAILPCMSDLYRRVAALTVMDPPNGPATILVWRGDRLPQVAPSRDGRWSR